MPTTFADLGVPATLCASLARRGIAEPFPIQILTLPDALAGRDICGRAPTGSGKTLAFGLAIVDQLDKAQPRRPRALVLVPTRELAAQVAGEIELLLGPSSGTTPSPAKNANRGKAGKPYRGRKNGKSPRSSSSGRSGQVVAIYGGASYGPQRRALANGAAIVVACPGRLEDLVAQGDVMLDDVDLVVIDEADRMADMGFLPAVRRLLDRTKKDRQTLLFSATLDGDIDALVRRYQSDPARHEAVADEEATGDVEHLFWRVATGQRVQMAADLVHRHGRAVVFCRTRRGADRLAKQLTAAGIKSAAIHGNRTQGQRERALAAFAEGRVSALVATDVAARGIHVDDVACVVHFDLPGEPKDYVHRSGRTGRAGATGTVVSLVPDEQRKAVRALQRALGLPEQLDAPDVITGRPTPSPRPEAADTARPAAPSNGRSARSGNGRSAASGNGRPSAAGGRNNGSDWRSATAGERRRRRARQRSAGDRSRSRS